MFGSLTVKMPLLALPLALLSFGTTGHADSMEVVVTTDPGAASGYAYQPPTFGSRIIVREREPRAVIIGQGDNGAFVYTRDRRLIDRSRRGNVIIGRDIIIVDRDVVRPQPVPKIDPIGRPGSVVNLLQY